MAKTIDNAKDEIASLIKHFRKNLDYVHSQSYKEVQARQEFIDPFFIALGWDVRNESRAAMQYREVIPEVSQDVEGHKRAPDYVFRVGRDPVFFVEAKKPGVQIKSASDSAYQLRRYAWSAKLALSILTDFEELAVYECLKRPSEKDKASAGRIKIVNYDEYIDHLQEIWDIFSRDAVWSGSFDQFTQSARGKRGTSEVDSEFLKEIEGWRDELAHNFALRNPKLNIDDLNDVVQLTIDRIIFLRMAEDRGMEPYGQLRELADGKNIYKKLIKEPCRRADERYNSGLFDFSTDKLTPKLDLDDKVMKYIIDDLYFPQSPYEFSVLPAEILGNVYEQFLGKVIRLTPGHFAKVEEKPEVKKAGGVYYTPAYIVEYIVKNTVGKMVEDKSPKQLEKLHVLDMACGSGSFLLGAFDYLLNHYLQWYISHYPGKHPKALWKHRDDWRLTTSEKKRILLTHIFGVDIDRQAVEVTKLSLLLKVLEGENDQTLSTQMDLIIKERALPNLDQNIKCGNSLIGPDYFTGDLIPDRDEMKRVNPFDWNQEFKEIMKDGGFDCVIGNPPYGADFDETEKIYLQEKYKNQSYQLDSYLLFLEKAVSSLLHVNGMYGMIIPNPWLTNLLQRSIRVFVVENTRVHNIVHFKYPVFKVTVDTEIVILEKAKPDNWKALIDVYEKLEDFQKGIDTPNSKHLKPRQQNWRELHGDVINIFINDDERALFAKCLINSSLLSDYCAINVGIKPYQAGKGTPPQSKVTVEERPFDSDRKINSKYRQYLRGCDINRYSVFPLESRFIKYGSWLAEPRNSANFDAPIKIFMRQTGDSLVAAYDENRLLCLNNMHVLVPKIPLPDSKYLLGIINSKLLNWYYHLLNPEVGEALAEVKKTNVAKLPIKRIDFSKLTDKTHHEKMVSVVNKMLDLHKQLHSTESASEREIYQRQINATDRQIDNLVYELYGLSGEEIRIVEEGTC